MKIRAFTIIELIVALAISATITTIAYYAISSVNRIVNIRQAIMHETENLHKLRYILSYDFSKNYNWEETGTGINTVNNEIIYEFSENGVSRIVQNKLEAFTFDEVGIEMEKDEKGIVLHLIKIKVKENNKQFMFRYPVNRDVSYRINKSELWE